MRDRGEHFFGSHRKWQCRPILPVAAVLIVLALISAPAGAATHDFPEVAKVTASDAAANENFGWAVSVSGDTMVVGSKGISATSGAYVYQRNQGGMEGWGEVKKLTPAAGAGGYFGQAVAIDGDTIVVGAKDASAAYIFERDFGGADNWGEVKSLQRVGGTPSDSYGFSVAIDGDTVVVGAWTDSDVASNAGAAYVFERDEGGADNWGQVKKLTASDGAEGDAFSGQANHGYTGVAVDGDTIVVGASYDDDGGSNSGSAYIFERDEGGAGNWGEVTKLVASDTAGGDYFGCSVSVSGDTVVVGAHEQNVGSAYLFERDEGGGDNWGEVQKLTPSDGSVYFGWAVSISGDRAAVGAWFDSDAAGGAGSVYIFGRDFGGGDNWGEEAEVFASDAASMDNLGEAVAIDGDTIVAAAKMDDDSYSASGSAYVFRVLRTGNDMVFDFGLSYGVWSWLNNDQGSWFSVGNLSPEGFAVGDFDNSGQDDVIFDFGAANGVWAWYDNDPAGWSPVTALDPSALAVGDFDGSGAADAAMAFAGSGVWAWYDSDPSSWQRVTDLEAEIVVAGDLDGDGTDDIILDLGESYGVWAWYGNDLTAGYPVTGLSPEGMAVGDLDGNGRDDVIFDLGVTYGVWAWYNDAPSGWVPVTTLDSGIFAVGDLDNSGADDVLFDFGASYGVWAWYDGDGASWVPVTDLAPAEMAVTDLDGDRLEDVVFDFGPTYGIWGFYNNDPGGWLPVTDLSSLGMASGSID